MPVYLTPFKDSDLPRLDQWCRFIGSDDYMSRTTPGFFNRQLGTENSLWNWYLIHVGQQCIGTVWLEKEKADSDTATLGILLGDNRLFNRGYGKQAVRLAVSSSSGILCFNRVRLNVRKSNQRAIACYRNCGFSVIGEGTKTGPKGEIIPFLTMETRVDA